MAVDQLVREELSGYGPLILFLSAVTLCPKHTTVHIACWSLWLLLLRITWSQRDTLSLVSFLFCCCSLYCLFFLLQFYLTVSSCLSLWIQSFLLNLLNFSSPSSFLCRVVQATVPTSRGATAVVRPRLPLTSPCSAGEQLFHVRTHRHTHTHTQPAKCNAPGEACSRGSRSALCASSSQLPHTHTNTHRHMWSDVDVKSHDSALAASHTHTHT